MYTSPLALLRVNGMWRPESWSSPFLINLYRIYTTIALVVFYLFIISASLDVIFVAENIKEITENLIQLINTSNVIQKTYCLLSKRSKIKYFINLFYNELSLPQNEIEEAIQKRFDNESRSNTRKLYVLSTISVITFVYLPYFMHPIEERKLVNRGWLPFSLDNVLNYRIAYVHQAWAITLTALTNAAVETLVSGFMIQICAQFAILEERFEQLPLIVERMKNSEMTDNEILVKEKSMLVRLVKHHRLIFEMSKLLNDIFVYVIMFHVVTGTIVLCVCTYNLANKPFNSSFIIILLFQSVKLLQIFIYTWYGNEITLRSVGLGYKVLIIDWKSLSPKRIKDLLFISLRTTKPIILNSGHVISLSNLAFTNILKTSYSIYNVLSVN